MEQPISLTELRKLLNNSLKDRIEDLRVQNPDPELDPVFGLLLTELETQHQAEQSNEEQMLTELPQDLPQTPEQV
jgi:hypothetical protein